jgi:5-formyltetrahydrofolate cyclo-ligase
VPSQPPSTPSSAEDLRARTRAARRALDGPERQDAESRIVVALAGAGPLRAAGRVALYLPTDGEVDLAGLHPVLRERGTELCLPVIGAGASMTFRRLDEGAGVATNRYGIPEPAGDGTDDVAAGDLDVVLVPCVAVDRNGRRLGFGAGFYDRALADAGRRPLTVGVAFDCQVVEGIDAQTWDVPMDLVVTESGVVEPGS